MTTRAPKNPISEPAHRADEVQPIVTQAPRALTPIEPRRLTMDTSKIGDEIDHHRRRFLGAAAMTIAAAQFGISGSADAQTSATNPTQLPAIKPGTNTSFASLKQIDAGLLNVGYAEAGPADGSAVVLLHGWPYDIYSFVDVAPLLASAGYRVIVPYLRGYGSTRFLPVKRSGTASPRCLRSTPSP
jgi:alpha/beta hydrolase fold